MATIAVRMGELAVSRDAGTALIIHGLGSCVGLSLWDPRARVAGMAHFMLPAGRGDEPPAKFVSGGLQRFLVAFEAAGGSRRRAQVKAAGGARILTLTSGLADIGRRNAEAVQAGLAALGMSLTASDLGGTMARTIELSTATGTLSVRSASVTRGL